MAILKKFFLILLTLILVIAIPVAIFLHSLSITVLEPYHSVTYIEQSGIYGDLEKVVRNELANYQADTNEIGSDIINTIVNRVANEIITSEWLASISANLQNNLWDYILGKTHSIEPISFHDFWESFMIITEEEINKYSDSELPNDLLSNSINNNFEEIVPQELDIMDTYDFEYSNLDLIKKYYNLGIKSLYILYLVIALALFLGILLLFKSRKALKWLGKILVISGIISFIPIVLNRLYQDEILTKINLSGILINLEKGLINLFNLITLDIMNNIILYSIIILVIGIILLIIDKYGNISKMKQQKTLNNN